MKIISRIDWTGGVIFWRPRAAGYTSDLDAAGRYDDEALAKLNVRPGEDHVMDEQEAIGMSHREVSRNAFDLWKVGQ